MIEGGHPGAVLGLPSSVLSETSRANPGIVILQTLEGNVFDARHADKTDYGTLADCGPSLCSLPHGARYVAQRARERFQRFRFWVPYALHPVAFTNETRNKQRSVELTGKCAMTTGKQIACTASSTANRPVVLRCENLPTIGMCGFD